MIWVIINRYKNIAKTLLNHNVSLNIKFSSDSTTFTFIVSNTYRFLRKVRIRGSDDDDDEKNKRSANRESTEKESFEFRARFWRDARRTRWTRSTRFDNDDRDEFIDAIDVHFIIVANSIVAIVVSSSFWYFFVSFRDRVLAIIASVKTSES